MSSLLCRKYNFKKCIWWMWIFKKNHWLLNLFNLFSTLVPLQKALTFIILTYLGVYGSAPCCYTHNHTHKQRGRQAGKHRIIEGNQTGIIKQVLKILIRIKWNSNHRGASRVNPFYITENKKKVKTDGKAERGLERNEQGGGEWGLRRWKNKKGSCLLS